MAIADPIAHVEIAQQNVESDPRRAALYRMLDDAFGAGGWRINDDPRFAADLHFFSFDIFVPVELQAETLEKAADVQAEFSRRFSAIVYLTITTSESE